MQYQTAIQTAFRILGECGITEEDVALVNAVPGLVHIHLDNVNRSSMAPLINVARRLGVQPELKFMDSDSGHSMAFVPLDSNGEMFVVGQANAFAEVEWPGPFLTALNEALSIEQMEEDAYAELPF
jgi:hypothetical protein